MKPISNNESEQIKLYRLKLRVYRAALFAYLMLSLYALIKLFQSGSHQESREPALNVPAVTETPSPSTESPSPGS